MQVSVETTSGLERRLTIGVPAERIDSEVNARLQKASKNIRINGFRPGKVPMKVIKQRFGEGVRQEVLGEVMNQSFFEAVQKEALKPAGMPQIEPKSIEAGKDLEFVATFDVFPDVEVKDFAGVEVVKPVAEVTDADVEKMIEMFRKQQATWEVVERAAAEGDKVNIDYVGTKDGEAFQGGSAEGQDLELGSGRMIPGFEDAIVGMKAGEEKVAALSFPEEYHNEELKGAAVEFKITVNSVSEQKLAELNEEMFEAFGVKEGGEEKFREEVRANMARELKNAAKNKVKSQVMDSLVKLHAELEVPKALIAEEIKALRGQMLQQFGGMAAQIDAEQLLPAEMFKDQAERRVKLGLVINEVVAKEALKVDGERVRETIEELASTYEDPEQVVNYYYGNQQQLQSIEAMVLEDMVVENLLAKAAVSEKECTYEEVMTPDAPKEEEAADEE